MALEPLIKFLFKKRTNNSLPLNLIENHQAHIHNFAVDRILTFARYAYENHDKLAADLYISHGVRGLAAANALSHLTDKEYLCDAIEYPSFHHRNTPTNWHPVIINTVDQLTDHYLRHCRAIMTVGSTLAEKLEHYNVPVYVVPNYRKDNTLKIVTHKAENYICLHKMCRIDETKKIILVLSTVTSNIHTVLEAIKTLPEDVHVVFLGHIRPPAYKIAMQQLATQIGLKKRCHWLEPVPYHQLLNVIACADAGLVVLDTSKFNSSIAYPNRIFDYMAGHIPFISPNIPDINKLIMKHQCGIIIDEISSKKWVNAINKILQDIDSYKNNVKNANILYRWENCEPILLKAVGKAQSVTILSMNDLTMNQRTQRISHTLAAHGIHVKIFCLSQSTHNKSTLPNIEYHLLKKF